MELEPESSSKTPAAELGEMILDITTMSHVCEGLARAADLMPRSASLVIAALGASLKAHGESLTQRILPCLSSEIAPPVPVRVNTGDDEQASRELDDDDDQAGPECVTCGELAGAHPTVRCQVFTPKA